ncbi:putative disease resistance protein At3g14460 [Trifolium pratense]|nr:putative disease resistance protein At3g14460 [Trifolium pratense]
MAELIAGAFLSSLFQVTLERFSTSDFKDLFNKGLVEKLEITLNSINQLLDDAETKQYQNQNVKKWLDHLKHEVYEVDQLLDEIATNAKQKIKVKHFVSTLTNRFESRIKDLLDKLKYLAEQNDVLGLTQRSCISIESAFSLKSSKISPTASLVDESCIYGRDHDKNKIINYLLSDNDSGKRVSIISIVGLGGMGKTTLAQLVYNDERMKKRFELKAWVHVAESFDVVGLTKTILRSFHSSADGEDLDPLKCQLQQTLTGKKFLLVLDDVWNANEEWWEQLLLPFYHGSPGSKIIVTTRDRHIALVVKSDHQHHLKQLAESDCWNLFVKHAFRGRNVFEYPNLESTGKKVVDKCGGSPLAVKTLGNLLQRKFSQGEWFKILETDMWHVSKGDDEINPVLRLSYHNLPSHLKRCFAYCSIFPKGYEFQKDELVKLWMAEGLLKCCGRDKSEEELGNEFLDDLESISFFQQSVYSHKIIAMHDLVNDLAKSESREFCLQIEGDKVQDISERTRHIWCSLDLKDGARILKLICKIKGLRSLLVHDRVYGEEYFTISKNVQRDLFSKLKYLRMLSFRGCELTELAYEIGNLKLLRYLDLTSTEIKSLPNSICKLYNLQTLILEKCFELTELPSDFYKLASLCHLNLECIYIKKMPKQIGRLNHLQTLSHFVVGENSGSDIKELDNLNHLQGKLTISGLENVTNPADAAGANLKDKKHLKELIMNYSDDFIFNNNGRELDVLEALLPNSNLKRLTIEYYNGNCFPNWLCGFHLPNLVSLKLQSCGLCSHLPPLGQLPCLRELSISHCDGIKIIGEEFYDNNSTIFPFKSLEVLIFDRMYCLEEWLCLEGFPVLKELSIINCPELTRALPQHFPSLQKLKISNCNKLEEWLCLEGFPFLKELSIINCPELKRAIPQHLPFLQKLKIRNCNKLEEWLCLEGLPLLKEIFIEHCPKLKRLLPQHLPSLQILEIFDCKMLEVSIPKGDSIIELHLHRCDRVLVNGLSTSLKKFVLRENRYTEFSVEQNLLKNTILEEMEFDFRGFVKFPFLDLRCYNSLSRLCIKGWCLPSLPFAPHLFTNLHSLSLFDFPQLESFPSGGLPSNLSILGIFNCPKLIASREEWGLFQLNSLKVFVVSDDFENIESFPEENLLPPNLNYLYLIKCSKLRIMNYKGFLHLKSLEDLCIRNCPSFERLPEEGLRNSLSSLWISDCPLIKEQYKKEEGERWHTIRHIPSVTIT